MHLQDLYSTRQTTISFEFFPPKDLKDAGALFETIKDLQPLKPSFVSVTYGAGGSTRAVTQELVMRIARETSLTVIPHQTCVCHTEAEIYDLLERYASSGIQNILALGGDIPASRAGHDRSHDAFRYAADLVRFVSRFRGTFGGRSIEDTRGFGVAVAGFPEGHPATPNRLLELDYLKAKVDAGASAIITQLFFDNHDFYDFRARCELAGIKVPIIAGIMPVTSVKGMRRMAELAAGARYPAPLVRSLQRAVAGHGDPDSPEAREACRRVGVHWATEQCRDLLDNSVRGLHLYTLNRSTASREIYTNLGVKDSMVVA